MHATKPDNLSLNSGIHMVGGKVCPNTKMRRASEWFEKEFQSKWRLNSETTKSKEQPRREFWAKGRVEPVN